MSENRKKQIRRRVWFGWMFAALIGLAVITAACTTATEPEETGSEESAGEHGSGGEGTESGNGETAEGGDAVVLLTADQTYDEVVKGARLVFSYDANTNAFVGTVENTTNGMLTAVRVEVHLSNGTELGPTPRTDLGAGEILDVNLDSTAAPFATWSAHAEIGNAEGGHSSERDSEGSEGSEAGSESSGAGTSTPAPATYLATSGFSRGIFTTQDLQADEAYAGNLNGLEFALTYDHAVGAFSGRVKNEAGEGICDVSMMLIFDGDRANSQSVLIPSLEISERANFTLGVDTARFTTWTVETNTFTCNDVPVHGGGEGAEAGVGKSGSESSEGAGHEGGSESGGEGAGHESGSEGGSEGGSDEGEGATTPIDQPTVATIMGLDVNFAYDQVTKAFRGTVTNNGSEAICGARMEIHVGRGSRTIELGPTVDYNYAPGDSQTMVLAFDAQPTDTYGLHPEVSPCP